MKTVISTLLCAALLSPASANAEQRFGDWMVGEIVENAGVYAGTANESAGIIAQYCYDGAENCFWILVTDIRCDDGHKYPVLANADTGAYMLELVCIKQAGEGRHAFSDFDTIDTLVKSSEKVGFAFPMANGIFQVSRFSLTGSKEAVATMRQQAERRVTKKKTGTRDLYL